MPRLDPKDYPPVVAAIMDGDHDDILTLIANACAARTKNRFRARTRIRVSDRARDGRIKGAEGVIVKANTKSVTVGLGDPETDQFGTSYSLGEWNLSPELIEVLP